MSFFEKLVLTYENNVSASGVGNENRMLPLFHNYCTMHIKVVLDENGNFIRANLLNKSEKVMLPCTETSASRGNIISPNPLADKLCYLDPNYFYCLTDSMKNKSGKAKKEKTVENYLPFYDAYLKLLSSWRDCSPELWQINSVYEYVAKGTLISDLVKNGMLFVDENGVFLERRNCNATKNSVDIFGLTNNEQNTAFVCWSVEKIGEIGSNLSENIDVINSWVRFCENQTKDDKTGFCWVSGEMTSIVKVYPNKIIGAKTNAKIISSNDDNGFTYRGLFNQAKDVFGLSNIVSEKAHNALRWLIKKQTIMLGGKNNVYGCLVVWSVKNGVFPIKFNDAFYVEDIEENTFTGEALAKKVKLKLDGYRNDVCLNDTVCLCELLVPVPGRISITYYREFEANKYLDCLESWFTNCCWLRKNKDGKTGVFTPSPSEIASLAYGVKINGRFEITQEKLMTKILREIRTTILDGIPLNDDIINNCVRNVVNRNSFKDGEDLLWQKSLRIALALIKYQNKERDCVMALETERNSRSYLFGRLLACMKKTEKDAQKERTTNAERLFCAFSDRPADTFRDLSERMVPYKNKLGRANQYIDIEIQKIMSMFKEGDFESNERLENEFLLGYSNQESWFYTKKEDKE